MDAARRIVRETIGAQNSLNPSNAMHAVVVAMCRLCVTGLTGICVDFDRTSNNRSAKQSFRNDFNTTRAHAEKYKQLGEMFVTVAMPEPCRLPLGTFLDLHIVRRSQHSHMLTLQFKVYCVLLLRLFDLWGFNKFVAFSF
jgi:hypothetical protein